MCTISQMIKRIEKFKPREVAAESMVLTKDFYLVCQKKQLNEGQKKKGGPITPDYAPATIKIKTKKGQPTDRVTLKDTGHFYASIFLVVIKGAGIYRTVSTDVKSKWLIAKYSEDILGISGKFKDEYVRILRPVWEMKVESVLQLKYGN